MRRSIERVFIGCMIGVGFLVLFSATSVGTEPLGSLDGIDTFIGPAPSAKPTGDVVETYIQPDPCGLLEIYCEGEESADAGTWRTVTAYTSEESQTDGSPCISADGSNVCERWQNGETLCAANFVPFGTILLLDNQKDADGTDAIVCTVVDRLSSRYPNRVDLYMGYDTPRALEFGVQTLFVKSIWLP